MVKKKKNVYRVNRLDEIKEQNRCDIIGLYCYVIVMICALIFGVCVI